MTFPETTPVPFLTTLRFEAIHAFNEQDENRKGDYLHQFQPHVSTINRLTRSEDP